MFAAFAAVLYRAVDRNCRTAVWGLLTHRRQTNIRTVARVVFSFLPHVTVRTLVLEAFDVVRVGEVDLQQ